MNDPLGILYVVRPAAGGIRRHVSLLTAGLRDRGERIAIAAPREFELDSAEGIPIYRAPISARTDLFSDLLAARIVARLARNCDLLHGHGLRGAWIARLAAGLARKPFVWTAHNLAPERIGPVARALLRSTARRTERIIAVSDAVANSLAAITAGCPPVVVIPNGIDTEQFDAMYDRSETLRRLDIPDDLRLVVGVGRLSPEKGFDILVHSAPRLLEQFAGACFVVAGDGPERHRLIALVREMDVEGRFLLEGYYRDVPRLLAAADVVAIPSRLEGQGIVALEAMAARKPVVASRVGGLAETVLDEETGLLVPPGEPAALTDALLRVLWDASLQTRLGEAGRARVESLYTADQMVSATLDVYRSVLHVPAPVPVG